jgi:hypothetical protein
MPDDVYQLVIVAKYWYNYYVLRNSSITPIMSQPESHSPAPPSQRVDEMQANPTQTSTTTNDPQSKVTDPGHVNDARGADDGTPAEHFGDENYPQQRHAGAVGYGPEYHVSHAHAKKNRAVRPKMNILVGLMLIVIL